jgi:hypothetical protein
MRFFLVLVTVVQDARGGWAWSHDFVSGKRKLKDYGVEEREFG